MHCLCAPVLWGVGLLSRPLTRLVVPRRYQQQDSQELMNFLLDGLHEDLNRVKKKPATETVESKGRADEIVAAEAWSTHLLRNRSMVVDTFQGQLKSDVQCDQCGRRSVTFDPFMSLSVPIPIKRLRDLVVTFIPYDGSPPVRYSAKVEKGGCIADFKAWMLETDGFDPDTLVVGDTYHHRIFRVLGDKTPLSSIRDNDVIMVYQVPALPGEPKKKGTLGRIASAITRSSTVDDQSVTKHSEGCVHLMYRHEETSYGVTRKQPHGDPRMLSLYDLSGERRVLPTNRQVLQGVLTSIKRLLVRGEELTVEDLPFKVVVANRSGTHIAGREVPLNDSKVEINLSTEALYVDFTAEKYRSDFDFKELVVRRRGAACSNVLLFPTRNLLYSMCSIGRHMPVSMSASHTAISTSTPAWTCLFERSSWARTTSGTAPTARSTAVPSRSSTCTHYQRF